MNTIKVTGLVVLAMLIAAPALAGGRERWHDRGRDGDRGSHWVFRDRDHRNWDRHRDRHRERYSERRPSWQYGYRGRDWGPGRIERRHHRRWSRRHYRHHHRPNVIIISPFGGFIGRMFD